jgi:hypothetical protein
LGSLERLPSIAPTTVTIGPLRSNRSDVRTTTLNTRVAETLSQGIAQLNQPPEPNRALGPFRRTTINASANLARDEVLSDWPLTATGLRSI